MGSEINCPSCGSKVIKKYFQSGRYAVYFCEICLNGFTYPSPKNISIFYNQFYWVPSGAMGLIKNSVFKFFQKRRVNWLVSYLERGRILEIGPGEGIFIEALPQNFKAVGLEPPGSDVKNTEIIKADFLKWKTKQKFDAIIFWESLEHVPNAKKYLKKAKKILVPKGYLFVEYPRFDSLEAVFFGKFWFHLDLPRHITHFTERGIKRVLHQNGFKVKGSQSVTAFEYTVVGLLASVMQTGGLNLTDKLKRPEGIIIIVFLFPFLIISGMIEFFLFILGQSPIGLVIAQKR